MGDFNINITADDNDCEALLTTLSCIGLHQIIETDTRITSTSASLIDHVYTNNVENITCSGTILTDISDHLPIFALIKQGSTDALGSDSPILYQEATGTLIMSSFVKICGWKRGNLYIKLIM